MSEHIDSLHDLQIMARYNRWANARLFACVATLSDEDFRRERDAFFGSIHATLNHILVGDRLWTSRIIGEYCAIKSLDEILYEPFDALQSARTAMDEHIVRMVDRLAVGLDGGLDAQVRYRPMAGGLKQSSTVRHILLTLLNHQTHHRGQVHCMLTQAGCDNPPSLDVIVMLREIAEANETA